MKEENYPEKSINHYKSIIDMIQAGINLIDKNGKIIYVNDAYCKMHNYSKEELIGKSLELVLPKQGQVDVLKRYKKIINKEINQSYTVESANIRRDGSTFPVLISWNYLLKDGNLDGMVSVIQDLSKIRAVEEALKESEEKYRSLIENIGDFIWEINEEGQYTYVSPKSKALYGYTQKELLDFKIWDNIIEKESESTTILENSINKKTAFSHIEVIKIKKDGEIIVIETSGIPIYDKNNQFKGFWGIDRDISAQKKIKEIDLEIKKLKERLEKRDFLEYIMGDSDKIKEVHRAVEKVGKTDFSVIITGETGTGKEIIANAIHQFSNREFKSLISVDCGAIPETLIESELFGNIKGAFTGAVETKEGAFQLANGGTLFLDEITNLSLEMQKKLLRVLQEKEVKKIGSSKKEELDIRIITASNENIMDCVEEGKFRKDLFFRLNEFTITVPPLKERKEDIPILIQRFLKEISYQLNSPIKNISKEAIQLLCNYNWPGNVRELKNSLKKAFVISDKEIKSEHFDFSPQKNTVKNNSPISIDINNNEFDFKEIIKSHIEKIEKDIIQEALNKFNGNKSKTARFLKIDYKTLLKKISDYVI
jgi:PAS domain S-box-containing protein